MNHKSMDCVEFVTQVHVLGENIRCLPYIELKRLSHQTRSENILPRPDIIGKWVTVGIKCVK